MPALTASQWARGEQDQGREVSSRQENQQCKGIIRHQHNHSVEFSKLEDSEKEQFCVSMSGHPKNRFLVKLQKSFRVLLLLSGDGRMLENNICL